MEAADFLGIREFKASDGWLTNFRRRQSISFKRLRGEAADIDNNALMAWQNTVLRNTLSQFRPEDIFNVDETALFWQLFPAKTLAFKGMFFYVFFQLFVWPEGGADRLWGILGAAADGGGFGRF